jgi:hypothetical protein
VRRRGAVGLLRCLARAAPGQSRRSPAGHRRVLDPRAPLSASPSRSGCVDLVRSRHGNKKKRAGEGVAPGYVVPSGME